MSGHSWAQHEREGWTVCTVCGLVRNYDRPDSQCRGTAKIALRSEQAVKPPCDLECGTCRYQLNRIVTCPDCGRLRYAGDGPHAPRWLDGRRVDCLGREVRP